MNSYFPRTIKEWNALPPHVIKSTSIDGFLDQLDTDLI